MPFIKTDTARSRKPRTCPECAEAIPAGAVYDRFCFRDGSAFVHGFHCAGCEELAKALETSQQLFDPLSTEGYRPGDLLAEAIEHSGLDGDCAILKGSPAEQRAALIREIAEMDRAEIAGRREEARQRRERDAGLLDRLRRTQRAREEALGSHHL